jgi:hypothetical protein
MIEPPEGMWERDLLEVTKAAPMAQKVSEGKDIGSCD